jgi:hypothetical protein
LNRKVAWVPGAILENVDYLCISQHELKIDGCGIGTKIYDRNFPYNAKTAWPPRTQFCTAWKSQLHQRMLHTSTISAL